MFNRFNLSLWLFLVAILIIFTGERAIYAEPANNLDMNLTPTRAPSNDRTPRPITLTPSHVPTYTVTPTQGITPIPTLDINLDDYEIWYLADEDVLKSRSLISFKYLFQDMQVERVSSAQDLDTERYPDVLIIHQSAGNWVDQTYVAAAVRRGVILTTIDVPLDDLADWMDSECIRRLEYFGPLVGRYEYTVFTSWTHVMTEDAADSLRMTDLRLNYDCSTDPAENTPAPPELVPEIEGHTVTHSTRSMFGIESLDDLDYFRQSLKIRLRNRENAIYTFQARFLSASPTRPG